MTPQRLRRVLFAGGLLALAGWVVTETVLGQAGGKGGGKGGALMQAGGPAEGLEVYELRYGARAKDKLDDAKQRGDRELLAEVAQRYCHTKAGIEANELLATLSLARGQNFMAALRFERILGMAPERTKLSELTIFKAALALLRDGVKKYVTAA